MNGYRKVTIALISGWFVIVLSLSALHLFNNASNRLGIAVGIAALIPIVVFSLWYAASEGFRRFALSLNPRVLTSIQAWRILAFTFVLLEAHGLLPAIFALPAGYGDMAIGATAVFIAWKVANPAHRNSFILWQVLGITDLITAVSLGTTGPLLDPSAASMTPMTVLPLSLVPTFFVPLLLIFHLICIAQARAWKIAPQGPHKVARPVQHPAS